MGGPRRHGGGRPTVCQHRSDTGRNSAVQRSLGVRQKSTRPPAAALRWSAQANAAYGFKLALQALPATARSLRKDARLAKDTTKAIELAGWTAVSPMAKEGSGNSPVPITFAPDPAATRTSLAAHPERLYNGKNIKIISPGYVDRNFH